MKSINDQSPEPTRWLLNSAVIPAGGYGEYQYREASWKELQQFLAGKYISRIGYADTANLIEQQTGYQPPLSRDLSDLAPGDVAMVVRLRYRVDPAQKGQPVSMDPADWEVCRLERK